MRGGRAALSVAALLRAHLSSANHAALLDAVSGKTMGQAREVLAAWFPKPDVPPLIRKLPAPPAPRATPVHTEGEPAAAGEAPGSTRPPALERATTPPPATAPMRAPGPSRRSIEPLSPERYEIQLTAGAELKRKLERARDLMRHAIPSGDLATIVERAIDMLLEQTLKRRFGQSSPAATDAAPMPTEASAEASRVDAESLRAVASIAVPEPSPAGDSRHVPNEVRRAVLARDGVRCTWRGPDGVRCDSRAWLEHDHVTPRALGGAHHAHNIRHLCRPHNQLAAELAFGRARVAHHIARGRARRHGRSLVPVPRRHGVGHSDPHGVSRAMLRRLSGPCHPRSSRASESRHGSRRRPHRGPCPRLGSRGHRGLYGRA